MADARAGVDVVSSERGAHELLHEEGFFVRATGRRDAAHRMLAVLRLNALDLAGGVGDRLIPAHFLPGIHDVLADHWLRDAVRVRGVAIRKAALHAGMPLIRAARAVRRHAHDFRALRRFFRFRLEGTADATV